MIHWESKNILNVTETSIQFPLYNGLIRMEIILYQICISWDIKQLCSVYRIIKKVKLPMRDIIVTKSLKIVSHVVAITYNDPTLMNIGFDTNEAWS